MYMTFLVTWNAVDIALLDTRFDLQLIGFIGFWFDGLCALPLLVHVSLLHLIGAGEEFVNVFGCQPGKCVKVSVSDCLKECLFRWKS